MKLAIIIHNIADTKAIDEAISKFDIKSFTRIEKATGKTINCEPLFDTIVWPGYYSITIIEDVDNQLEKIRPEIKQIKENLRVKDLKYLEVNAENWI